MTRLSHPSKINMEAFFMLITVDFIGLERHGGKLLWNIKRREISVFDTNANFEFDENWRSVNTFPASQKYLYKIDN